MGKGEGVVGAGVVVASAVVPPGAEGVVEGARVVVGLQDPIAHSKLVGLKKLFDGQVMT